MDHLQTRLEALEQQMHTVTRRLHWWRGLAYGSVVLAMLTWALPAVIAQEEASQKGEKGLAQRVAALEELLKQFSRDGNEVFITGANLHIVNGLGSTDCENEQFEPIPDCPNGVGNLIVGYNELRDSDDIRTGSHNVVVGQEHNFSRFGGVVVGRHNTISGDFAAVSGGEFNTASGDFAAVSGGEFNTASGQSAAVSGGGNNMASGFFASVSGGGNDPALGPGNTASGFLASVSGGFNNTASGEAASVSGGGSSTASGLHSAVSGGSGNMASGDSSSVSSGRNITQETEFGWSAGSEADEVVVGNFRSP